MASGEDISSPALSLYSYANSKAAFPQKVRHRKKKLVYWLRVHVHPSYLSNYCSTIYSMQSLELRYVYRGAEKNACLAPSMPFVEYIHGGGLCGWHARSYACFCVVAYTLGSVFKGSDFTQIRHAVEAYAAK